MLKETETKETIGFFVTFLSLVTLQLGGGQAPCPPWLRLSVEACVNSYGTWAQTFGPSMCMVRLYIPKLIGFMK